MNQYVEQDFRLRQPFRRRDAVIRLGGDELPKNRVEGFRGHIGTMTPKEWEHARNANMKES